MKLKFLLSLLFLVEPSISARRSEAEQLRQFLKADRALGSHQPHAQARRSPVTNNDAGAKERRTDRCHRFLNNKTQPFAVDGSGIPEVRFNIGESYAGLLPVSNKTDEQDSLYFWFFPTVNEKAKKKKEIIIWLNGGPGCSSLLGLLQENGPFIWQPGMPEPVRNPWSWHLLSNIVYIEQPVGTGFAKGTPTVENEDDVARQFLGFWRNFIDTFGMQGYKVYIVAESYGGMFGPYISSHMLNANDTTYSNLQGLMIYDGLMFNQMVQYYVATENFLDESRVVMPLADKDMAYIRNLSESCGFRDYISTYLTFPPPRPAPIHPSWSEKGSDGAWKNKEGCDKVWDLAYHRMFELNPCFNVYSVGEGCPPLADPLTLETPYFDRKDVKMAIHAPLDVTWSLCTDRTIFPHGDASSDPGQRELPQVIDATKNVIIVQGGVDFTLLPLGTLLGIQNMTWGGKQGFQTRPTDPFYVPKYYKGEFSDRPDYANTSYANEVPAGVGVMGTTHHERGLIFVATQLAGHEGPQYAPAAALRHIEKLLGRVHSLSDTQPFTLPELVNVTQHEKPLGKGTFLFPCFGKGC
ncbi:Carboxypeptidase D [Purpureocillium takamizusanense]|uniref:Carboxypeptidase n=1 Tax=Purpureocillium takamizusanense TaxID=2060973 RepID=A0A9Q8QSS4_9HYPO|nr:Carboxypeptidase D [Purpureocillium takamizusanense]UNI23812.1 Carboxypeptidase D [Purpureocillium takamizusanense]